MIELTKQELIQIIKDQQVLITELRRPVGAVSQWTIGDPIDPCFIVTGTGTAIKIGDDPFHYTT